MCSEGCGSCPVCLSVCLQAILAVCTITSKTKDTIVLSVKFVAMLKGQCKVRAFFTYLGKDGHFVLPCFVYFLLHVYLCVTHIDCQLDFHESWIATSD